MNSFVIAVLLFAVGQVAAHSYSPYKKTEGENFLTHGDRGNDDGVDLGQLFDPGSETTTKSDDNGPKIHGRPALGIFWGLKKPQQHYRRNYQDMGENGEYFQGGERYPEQGVNLGQQDWQRTGQQHGGSGGYGLNYNEDVGVKGRELYQDGYKYLGQHKMNPQDYNLGSATGKFLEQEQQIFGGGKKQRVFHPDEQQEGGRFVVNQQRRRGNQEDSNESAPVEKKNSVRQSSPGYF
ncbi:hypothetical protein RI129_007725 [Pyrocoelia pectoralis]|uniref:Uncharacterized protein n=1 Tax=Pyrocoelia pectoralis TaxID=417401 RepID=A0AAN7ZF58_9COLE